MVKTPVEELIAEIYYRFRWAEPADHLLEEVIIGKCGDAFPYLVPQLSDPENGAYAFEIMMWIDSTRSMQYALPLLQDDTWQFTICYLIARLGGSSIVTEKIIEILKNGKDAGTRVMAAAALEQVGDKKAIEALMIAQNNDFELDSGGWSVSAVAEKAINVIQANLRKHNHETTSR